MVKEVSREEPEEDESDRQSLIPHSKPKPTSNLNHFSTLDIASSRSHRLSGKGMRRYLFLIWAAATVKGHCLLVGDKGSRCASWIRVLLAGSEFFLPNPISPPFRSAILPSVQAEICWRFNQNYRHHLDLSFAAGIFEIVRRSVLEVVFTARRGSRIFEFFYEFTSIRIVLHRILGSASRLSTTEEFLRRTPQLHRSVAEERRTRPSTSSSLSRRRRRRRGYRPCSDVGEIHLRRRSSCRNLLCSSDYTTESRACDVVERRTCAEEDEHREVLPSPDCRRTVLLPELFRPEKKSS
ncbi:hypothetical protein Droror1_Dr00007666 [Drosera rotundifolia]